MKSGFSSFFVFISINVLSLVCVFSFSISIWPRWYCWCTLLLIRISNKIFPLYSKSCNPETKRMFLLLRLEIHKINFQSQFVRMKNCSPITSSNENVNLRYKSIFGKRSEILSFLALFVSYWKKEIDFLRCWKSIYDSICLHVVSLKVPHNCFHSTSASSRNLSDTSDVLISNTFPMLNK